MAFCGNCGNQMEGNERFCVKCGRDMTANGATTATAPPPAAPVTAAPAAPPPPPPVQQMQPMQPPMPPPPGYMPPGVIPMGIPMQPPPAKKGGMFGTIVVVVLILGGIGYYYDKHPPTPAAGGAAPSSQWTQDEALAKQQAFDAHWDAVNGFVQLSNGKWTNNSTAPVQSATLECDQFDTAGNNLDQMRTTLNGPLQPGTTDSFNAFQMGAVATNMNKVTCTIIHVKQPGEPAQ